MGPEQVAYVWADALVNYLSALSYAPGEDLEEFWPAVHLLGKDILRFHCVYWPAMLLSAGYEVPKQLFVHGWLLLDDRKISKSLGNAIDPLDLIDVYGADAVRFWCVRAVSFGQDGAASIDGVHERYERELGNDLGNLLSRTTAMIARYRGGHLDASPSDTSPIRAELSPLAADVAARLDAFDLTGALERIWEVVRALNRYRRDTGAVAAREGRGERRRARPDALRPRRRASCGRDGARRVHPGHRGADPRGARPAARPRLGARRLRAHGRPRRHRGRRAALPAHRRPVRRGVIDTHAHLDACADPPEALVGRAREAGVTRIVTVATTLDGCRGALALADAHDGVYAALGIHPHEAGGDEAAHVDELEELLAHPKAVAVGETGLDYYRDYAPHDAQLRLFEAQLGLAEAHGKPVVIHTRAADADTAAVLAGFPGEVILHCFSSPALLPLALERRWYVSFAGNVTYPKAPELRETAAQVPADRILAETDCPYLAPQPRRGRPSEPADVVHTLAVLAEARGEDPAELERRIDANAAAVFQLS